MDKTDIPPALLIQNADMKDIMRLEWDGTLHLAEQDAPEAAQRLVDLVKQTWAEVRSVHGVALIQQYTAINHRIDAGRLIFADGDSQHRVYPGTLGADQNFRFGPRYDPEGSVVKAKIGGGD